MSSKHETCITMPEVSRMSHHVKIYIDGPLGHIGHARITNDGKILSIWIKDQQQLFVPDNQGEEE